MPNNSSPKSGPKSGHGSSRESSRESSLRSVLSDDAAITRAYHLWYYNHEKWAQTSFLGVPCLKSVSDMWNYQEILTELQVGLIIEFGTYCGGSALYYSSILRLLQPNSRVFLLM